MPVGTSSVAAGNNHLAQISGRVDGESREIREPVERSIVGGQTIEGVSIGGNGSGGDLNAQPDEPVVVSVINSTDLNALAQAVALASLGEDLLVEGSSFNRTPGGINIDAGTAWERTLTLRNSLFAADVIKARGFQNNGADGLIIENSRFDASTLVRLYSEGSSKLRFRGNVEINSPLAQFAGQTVQVDAGSVVRASGNVKVNASSHNYDAAGFGTIEAVGEKTRGSYESRSRY